MDLGIDGRVALVIGGSRGLGRGIAAELAREGATVALTSRDAARATEAAAEIGAAGGFAWDTADVDGGPALLESVAAALGPVDILVCNTGGPPAGDPLGFERAEWEQAYASLVLAPLGLVGAALPGMRERGWGRIVNVVSTTVREATTALFLSTVHRSATLAAFKALSRDVAADGVTINNILPGRIATDRLAELFGSMENAETYGAADIPLGRLGTIEEFAAATTFLCSARASYLTGVSLLVDGGLTRAV